MDGTPIDDTRKPSKEGPSGTIDSSTATDMAENLESNSMPASSAEEKLNNGYGRRRREAARYISQSDSVPATIGNRDQ